MTSKSRDPFMPERVQRTGPALGLAALAHLLLVAASARFFVLFDFPGKQRFPIVQGHQPGVGALRRFNLVQEKRFGGAEAVQAFCAVFAESIFRGVAKCFRRHAGFKMRIQRAKRFYFHTMRQK